jgi:hypothetical protein
MGTFMDRQIHPKDRRPGDEPPSTTPHRDTVQPQTLTPRAPVGSVVDDEGVIHIGAVPLDA